MSTSNIIYMLSLLVVAIIVWWLIYQAQFLAYDDNYGNLLLALFISIASVIAIIFLWFRQRQVITACKWQTLLFLLFASPVTVVLVSVNYMAVFGVMLKN